MLFCTVLADLWLFANCFCFALPLLLVVVWQLCFLFGFVVLLCLLAGWRFADLPTVSVELT